MDIKQKFGQAVKLARQAANMSQEELAMRIDADQAYVSRIEAGQINATLETLHAIASALNVEVSSLFANHDPTDRWAPTKNYTAVQFPFGQAFLK